MSNSLWQTLLAACRQVWVDPDFNEENFPLEPVAPDEDEWEVHERHFEKKVFGEKTFRRLEEMGYRLCGPRWAMQYIAEHPDLQLNHPLIATARWWHPCGFWCAPIFGGGHVPVFERNLVLLSLARRFGPRGGWLVLRRKQK